MHEARFPEVWDDPVVWLSPFVIDLYAAAVEERKRRAVESGDTLELENLEKWLNWPGRTEYKVFKSRLLEDEWLQDKVSKDGVDFIRWALRPFVVDNETLGSLADCAKKLTASRTSSRIG